MKRRPLVEVGKTYDYPEGVGSNLAPGAPAILGVRVVRIEGGDFIDQRGLKWNWETGGWIERPDP